MKSVFNFIIIISLSIILIMNCSPYSLPPSLQYNKDENALKFYMKSIDHFLAEEYHLALELIEIAIDMNRNFAQFHKLKADIYFQIGEDEKALKSYHDAVNHRSNFIEVYLKMGEIYKRNNRYEDAIKAYRKALISDQKYIYSYIELARCYLALDRPNMSLNCLEDYMRDALEYKIEPVMDYYFQLAKVYYEIDRYKDALVELQKIKEPFDDQTLHLFGRCYYALGEYDDGLYYFNKLLSLDKDVGEYYHYRGIYYYQKNNLDDAISQFKLALELDDSLCEAHYYLSKIYETLGNKEEAIKQYQLYNSLKKISKK